MRQALWLAVPVVESVDARRAGERIAYLDGAAASEVGRDYKRRMLQMLDLRVGQTVVDVGCGPGTDLAALAAAVSDDGAVIGVDHEPVMAAEARRRTVAHGQVVVCAGDAHALPLAGGSVDRARADRVLMHLADPLAAVTELRRVVRPDGLVALAEPDWDTLVIGDADIETSRAYTRFVTDEVVRNATIGRQLPRLLADAGFVVGSVTATAVLFRDRAEAEPILRLRHVAERAWQAGALVEAAGRAWLQRLAHGPFLASFTLFTAVCRAGADQAPAQDPRASDGPALEFAAGARPRGPAMARPVNHRRLLGRAVDRRQGCRSGWSAGRTLCRCLAASAWGQPGWGCRRGVRRGRTARPGRLQAHGVPRR